MFGAMLRRLLRRGGGGVSGFVFIVALCLPSFVLVCVLLSASDSYTQGDSDKQDLNERIADLRGQLDHLRMIDQAKRKAFFELQRQFQWIIDSARRANVSSFLTTNLTHHSFSLLASIDDRSRAARLISNMSATSALNPDLSIPNLFDHLPHLLQSPEGLTPAAKVGGEGRSTKNLHLVIGIPTIKRPKVSYLVTTLRSLLENLSPTERESVLIVVEIAELQGLTEWAQEQILLLQSEFPSELRSGLLEIVVPSHTFYPPDLARIPPTFGDSPERMLWRTKQNLDYAYLMMYAQARGRYYMQLEDDVITKTNFYEQIRDFIVKQETAAPPTRWFLLEFSSLGFIGKLFRTRDLPLVVDFLLAFHREKPVDWLLDNILHVRLCSPEKSVKHCADEKAKARVRLKPSLFQHIGTHSSLRGKIQKLKEKDFGKQPLHRGHKNPQAKCATSLKTYQKYTIERAYAGETFFWSLLPQPGDWVTFSLTPPVRLSSLTFHSGNAEHPDDQFFNTSVEIRVNSTAMSDWTKTTDGFWIVGWFSQTGSASFEVNTTGEVEQVRLVVHTESANWAILSEIWLKPMEGEAGTQAVPLAPPVATAGEEEEEADTVRE